MIHNLFFVQIFRFDIRNKGLLFNINNTDRRSISAALDERWVASDCLKCVDRLLVLLLVELEGGGLGFVDVPKTEGAVERRRHEFGGVGDEFQCVH